MFFSSAYVSFMIMVLFHSFFALSSEHSPQFHWHCCRVAWDCNFSINLRCGSRIKCTIHPALLNSNRISLISFKIRWQCWLHALSCHVTEVMLWCNVPGNSAKFHSNLFSIHRNASSISIPTFIEETPLFFCFGYLYNSLSWLSPRLPLRRLLLQLKQLKQDNAHAFHGSIFPLPCPHQVEKLIAKEVQEEIISLCPLQMIYWKWRKQLPRVYR